MEYLIMAYGRYFEPMAEIFCDSYMISNFMLCPRAGPMCSVEQDNSYNRKSLGKVTVYSVGQGYNVNNIVLGRVMVKILLCWAG